MAVLSFAFAQSHKVDSVVVLSDNTVLPYVGERIFTPLKASAVGDPLTAAFGRIIKETPGITPTTNLTLARFDRQRIAAVIDMEPQFESHVSGIMGSGKSESGRWESQGELNLHLENLWATAGAVDVVWSRKAVNSQFTKIGLTEPYLPRLPVGIKLGWREHLQEGLTLSRSGNISILMRTPFGWTWGTGFRKSTIRPTDLGRKSGLTESSSKSFTAELSRSSTDDSWLPAQGYSVHGSGDLGIEKKLDQSSALSRIELESEFYHPVSGKWILKTALSGRGTWSGGGEILEPQQVRFGGMKSLRGYREDFFRADWVILPNLELRYRTSKSLHFSAFIETAFHSEEFETPVGYGIGLLQRTDAAVLQVFYGLGRNDNPSDGKIHLLLTGLL